MAKNLLICSLPRTGSTLLCNLLNMEPSLDVHQELLNPTILNQIKSDLDLNSEIESKTFPSIWQKIVDKYGSKCGVLAFKTHYHQLKPFLNTIEIQDFLKNAVLVLLKRNDKLSQAISYEIANQTQQWNSSNTKKYNAQYNADAIQYRLDQIATFEQEWLNLITDNNLTSIEISYEELVFAPQEICMNIFDQLGVSSKERFAIEDQHIKKQASGLNVEWKARFLELNQ